MIGQNVSLGTSLSELDRLFSSMHFTLFLKGFPFTFVVGGSHGEITHAGLTVIDLMSFTHSLTGVMSTFMVNLGPKLIYYMKKRITKFLQI